MISHAPANVSSSATVSILAYCLASISMTVANKYCVSGPKWNMSFFFLACQFSICVVAIQVCKVTGLISGLSSFDSEKAKKCLPIALLLVGMTYTGTQALQFLPVPVYTIFKNLTIIVIAYGEVLWFGGRVLPTALLAFGLMVLSSVVAAWSDIQNVVHDFGPGTSTASLEASAKLATLNAGYAWMGLNVFCSAAYALSMRKVLKKIGFKEWDAMFYNNLLSIPILIIGTILTEDWSDSNIQQNFPLDSRHRQIFAMLYSGLGTIFISYATAWCIRITSSTTYSMVGALNKLPIAVSGLVFFGDPVTVGGVSAIALGFISGLVFTWAKISDEARKKLSLPTQEPRGDSKRNLELK